jgi:hypothetical protein
LNRDLEEHLDSCGGCRRLLASFRVVVETLTTLPRPQPAPDITERIVRAIRKDLAPRASSAIPFPGLPFPKWGNWAAAAAAAVFIVVLLFRPPAPLAGLSGTINQWGHRAYSFGLRAYRGSERLVDELNVLRMAVGVAFEDRLDRINERIKDLEEARRKSEDPPEKSSFFTSPAKLTYLETSTGNTVPRSTI